MDSAVELQGDVVEARLRRSSARPSAMARRSTRFLYLTDVRGRCAAFRHEPKPQGAGVGSRHVRSRHQSRQRLSCKPSTVQDGIRMSACTGWWAICGHEATDCANRRPGESGSEILRLRDSSAVADCPKPDAAPGGTQVPQPKAQPKSAPRIMSPRGHMSRVGNLPPAIYAACAASPRPRSPTSAKSKSAPQRPTWISAIAFSIASSMVRRI
jgi:hypothetical protein